MKKSVLTLLTLTTLLSYFTTFSQKAYHVLQDSSYKEPVLLSGVLSSYKTFVLNTNELHELMKDSPEKLSLSIPNSDGNSFDVVLEKKNPFANGCSVKTPDGVENNIDLGVHYSGKLSNDNSSLAAFSFYNNCMFGMIATDEGNYNIVFLRDEAKNPSQRYVLYNDRNLAIKNNFSCASEFLEGATEPENQMPKTEEQSCRSVKQYLECDYKMFQDNGNSVQNTVSWTTGMFNVMSTLFSAEQVQITISEIYVWNTNDGYTSSNANEALKSFGNKRKDAFNGDIAHLLSTKNENNGGLAWINVLCKSYIQQLSYGRFAYSNIDDSYANLPLWSWTINVVTHETGHNLGSHHTHWCGWELSPGNFGPIDHCYPTEVYNGFQCYTGPTQAITGTIMSYCHISGTVNMNLGFGTLPGNAIRNGVLQSACLGPSAPTVAGKMKYCAGENIQLTASFVGGSLSWSGPQGYTSTSSSITIPNSSAAHAGQYSAKVLGASCTAYKNVQVSVSEKPDAPVISENGLSLHCFTTSTADSYRWFNESGNEIATGASCTPGNSGNYYAVSVNNGCESEPSSMYWFYNILSVEETTMEKSFTVFPNPANDYISVSYNHALGHTYFQILDMNGRLVYQANTNTTPLQIDTRQLPDGMYILELHTANSKERSKFLVNH